MLLLFACFGVHLATLPILDFPTSSRLLSLVCLKAGGSLRWPSAWHQGQHLLLSLAEIPQPEGSRAGIHPPGPGAQPLKDTACCTLLASEPTQPLRNLGRGYRKAEGGMFWSGHPKFSDDQRGALWDQRGKGETNMRPVPSYTPGIWFSNAILTQTAHVPSAAEDRVMATEEKALAAPLLGPGFLQPTSGLALTLPFPGGLGT